jgi:hypothetical protein
VIGAESLGDRGLQPRAKRGSWVVDRGGR